MPQYSWQDVASGAIDSAPEIVKSSFGAAQSFACGLYRDYEKYFGNIAPQGPAEGLKRGVWDKLCGPGLPPPPSDPPPWNGDTCACVPYDVRGVHFATSPGAERLQWGLTALGPIFGVKQVGSFPGGVDFFLESGQCSGGIFTGTRQTKIGGASVQERKYIITSITPTDGPPASCPAPLPNPIPPPQPPPPDRQSERAPIVISPGLTLNVPVTLVGPTTNVEISPNIEVNVGPVNVNIGLGGVNIEISPSFNPTLVAPVVVLPPLPFPRPPALPPSGGDCPDPCEAFDYPRIERAIAAERKFYAKPKTRLLTTVAGTANAGTIEIPPRTRFVRVVLTREPNSVKEQAGAGGPDVLFAGWCSWGIGTAGERIPLNYRQSTFVLPFGMTQFSWTTYQGAIAQISVMVEEDLAECETSTCSPL